MQLKRKPIIWGSVAICLVAAFWAATAFFGAPAIRAKQLHEMGLDSSPPGVTDISYMSDDTVEKLSRKPKHLWPWFRCQAFARLPFIVHVEYGQLKEPLNGFGTAADYFWFFGASFRLREYQTWIA
jgi:hypothetical protein